MNTNKFKNIENTLALYGFKIDEGDYQNWNKQPLLLYCYIFYDNECNTTRSLTKCNEWIEYINLLLYKGANVNLQNRLGYTAISYIDDEINIKLVKSFLEHGADITLKDYYGRGILQNTYNHHIYLPYLKRFDTVSLPITLKKYIIITLISNTL